MRWPRVLPLVIVAAALLLALKGISFVSDGGTVFAAARSPAPMTISDPAYRPVVSAQLDPAAAAGSDARPAHDDGLVPPLDPTITGSVKEPAPAAAPRDASAPATVPAPATKPAAEADATPPNLDGSPTEAKLLRELRAQRSGLKERARQIDLREALVKAAEMRLQQRLADLRNLSAGATVPGMPPPKLQRQRMTDLVAVYSGMKAKDAAVIFNRLDTNVLMAIATRMKPRQFSDILGAMDPAAAERLTLALAGHGTGDRGAALDSLPKIEGRAKTP